MAKLTIDNQKIEIEEGATILEAAAKLGINIPTLCQHESLSPIGSCRLCVVEVPDHGKPNLITACNYPVAEGMEVTTNSPAVIDARKMVVELLLARSPQSSVIQELAQELGISESRFTVEVDDCILCQRCLRTCREIVGVEAISFAAPSAGHEVAQVSIVGSEEKCIGCGSCAYVCPTDAITMEDVNGTRILTLPGARFEFALKKCSVCGGYWAPEKQLDYIAKLSNQSAEIFDACLQCRD